MWEAMAAGAVPVVSPLDSITPLVKDGENAVMARNLYPHEIADALVRTMTDDALVDRIAATNKQVVRQLAGRDTFRPKVLEFYKSLAAGNRTNR
jgi:glycosyltransferase involved in cell wall biosynthesis